MIPSSSDNLPTGSVPPPVPPEPTPKPSHGRQFVAFLLSVCLGLFLADAVISLLDDSLILFLGIQQGNHRIRQK